MKEKRAMVLISSYFFFHIASSSKTSFIVCIMSSRSSKKRSKEKISNNDEDVINAPLKDHDSGCQTLSEYLEYLVMLDSLLLQMKNDSPSHRSTMTEYDKKDLESRKIMPSLGHDTLLSSYY